MSAQAPSKGGWDTIESSVNNLDALDVTGFVGSIK